MRDIALTIFCVLIALAVLTLVAAKLIASKVYVRTKPKRCMIFQVYHKLDRCCACSNLLHSYHICDCGVDDREVVVVSRITYNDGDVEFEVIENETQSIMQGI